jgi:thioester reductase-like protein
MDFQSLAGRVTHVFNSAAKVNLNEPFELMRGDNVDSTCHLLEFCCSVQRKALHHISTMATLTPDMLDRNGRILEATPLGEVRTLPLAGTGDQAYGYVRSKWLAEKLVFEAAKHGVEVQVHRPGLIGGESQTGVVAEDVFFHFLSDVVRTRMLPDMEGKKFNITPVDFVAKCIVRLAMTPGCAGTSGSAYHPAIPDNVVTMDSMASILAELGYKGLQRKEFTSWRERILADPVKFKSWSSCTFFNVDGDGMDSMADAADGAKAMRDAVGAEAFDAFDPRACLERMLRYCQNTSMLPAPDDRSMDIV